MNLNPGNIQPTKEVTANSVDNPAKEIADQEWLKNFKASVPKAGNQTPVVIKVIRSDNNSKKQ